MIKDFTRRNEYIAFVEQVENSEDIFDLILDGVEIALFNEITEKNLLNNEFINSIPTQIFSLKVSQKQYLELEGSSWLRIILSNNPSETSVDLYTDIFFDSEPEQLYIEDIKPTSIENKKKIFSMNIFLESSRRQIKSILNNVYSINSVVVYNVGQGNCNGICDSSGVPNMYFDFGGGVFQNAKTYPGNYENPKEINFCYTTQPPVLLSHWDWDHMASIRKNKHSAIKESKWIVPKQEIGISHLKIAVELYNRGNLVVWPTRSRKIKTNILEIQKISISNKKDRNNNGLVLTVKTNEYDYILLPGDANYEFIKKKRKYIGLVATHHGASSHGCLKKIPYANCNSKIAYSFGSKNSYHHPETPSIAAHVKKGWSNIYFTVNGHISLGNNKIYKMPCGDLCTLGDTQ